MLNFNLAVLVLAALVFFPASRFIHVLSVRRLEKREARRLDEAELEGQLRRARLVAVPVCLLFSYLFNLNVFGR